MTTKCTRHLDNHGRIIIPPHIREQMNLGSGSGVEVTLSGDSIVITPIEERCAICGDGLRHKVHAEIAKGKCICRDCAEQIAGALAV